MITDALLLRATDYRDADRIVTLFTRDAGKLSAVARGARGSKRRFAGSLEPYAVIRVELDERRADLLGLKRAEMTRVFPNILSELLRMDVAAGALALVREAHPVRVPDEALFVAAVQYLTVVDHEGDPQRSLLLAFALRVLSLMGIAPRLEECGRSGVHVPVGRAAYFDPTVGAVVSRRYGGGPFLLSPETRTRMVRAQGEAWLEGAREVWDEAELQVARSALAGFMRVHFQAELASRLFPG
ncbi:MAG: recombination and repair protein RecO [Myxococcaceae bacterium]|nr:recombination and repair protein RecO [Myxococcaceae bacterium]